MMLEAAHRCKMMTLKLHEDEITSTVFGPLRYFPAQEIFSIFRDLLDLPEGAGSEPVEEVVFDFWPNLATDGGRVEPDLLIQFVGPKGPGLSVLVEVKWDTGRSSACQLVAQWRQLLASPSQKGGRQVHVYLVKHRARGAAERHRSMAIARRGCEECDTPRTCTPARRKRIGSGHSTKTDWLKLVTWGDVRLLLRRLAKNDSPMLSNWAGSCDAFLSRVGITTLEGFRWVDNVPLNAEHVRSATFWNPEGWFDFLKKNDLLVLPRQEVHFWDPMAMGDDNGIMYTSE
ncbi:MAG: hypothetical protein ACYC6J_09760 [Coriobacteriia bacterium]